MAFFTRFSRHVEWAGKVRLQDETVNLRVDASGLTLEKEEPPQPQPVAVSRITGIAEEEDALLLTEASGENGAQMPQPGELVLIRSHARMADPWKGYCADGVVMRVRAIDRRRPGRCISVQPAFTDARTLHYEWFRPADLEPYDDDARDTGAELRDRLLSRFSGSRGPQTA